MNLHSIPEYLNVLEQIGSYDEVLICGDFNLPNIRWDFDDDISGLMVPTSVEGTLEEEFVEGTAFFGLHQILEQPSDRNHLDLAFVTDVKKFNCIIPIPEDLFDRPSRFHHPFVISLNVTLGEPTVTKNVSRLNLKKTRTALARCTFESVSEEDIFSELWSDNYVATAKLDRNVEKLAKIVDLFTPTTKTRESWLDKQPWLRGDKALSLKERKRANDVMNLLGDEASITSYKQACRVNFAAF